MRYLILKLDEPIVDDPPERLVICTSWSHIGKGLSVYHRDHPGTAAVAMLIPVMEGGVTEQAIEANLVYPKAEPEEAA